MNPAATPSLTPRELFDIVYRHRKLIIAPTIVCALLAAVYSLVAPRRWRASQALIVRAEAAGVPGSTHLGKFSDLSEMKTLQETIFELAKSQSVIKATLERADNRKRRKANWPTPKDVDTFRKRIKITPPGGAEFGKTEVFYLSVIDTRRSHAKQLVAALCDELETRLQKLRDERAGSMIAELENAVTIAERDLASKTSELTAIETEVGADLAELRLLASDMSGNSETSQQLRDIEAERRKNAEGREASEQLIVLLQRAQANPQQLVAMPNRLLESQPALNQLKQALVDAQVAKAEALAARTPGHPFVQAAIDAEKRILEGLQQEFAAAIEGLQFDVKFRQERDVQLQHRKEEVRSRMARLAATRAGYANVVAAVKDHSTLLKEARHSLADARARQAGARSASVIGRIDDVEAGTRPVGLGRKAITAAGVMGGLLLGLGVVFLIATPTVPEQSNSPLANFSTRDEVFGMFRGMTLAEAIRKVEDRMPSRNGNSVRSADDA